MKTYTERSQIMGAQTLPNLGLNQNQKRRIQDQISEEQAGLYQTQNQRNHWMHQKVKIGLRQKAIRLQMEDPTNKDLAVDKKLLTWALIFFKDIY